MPGLLVIISSPSGGGKDAVIKRLIKIFPSAARLVTTTTRPPRPREINGREYFFVDQKTFKEKLKNEEMIEYNIYAEHYYGTEKKRLNELLKKYRVVFTNIDVNGKHSFTRAHIPHLSIFLLPDSMATLEKRIKNRGGLSEEQIKERVKTAKNEIKQAPAYDFSIVNTEGLMEKTVQTAKKIIQKRLKLAQKQAKPQNP